MAAVDVKSRTKLPAAIPISHVVSASATDATQIAVVTADTVPSSVHRFKGQEAGYVKIADDLGSFCTPNLKATSPAFIIDEEEANLAYVAVTRARVQLDLGGFAATLRESLTNARKLLDLQPAIF